MQHSRSLEDLEAVHATLCESVKATKNEILCKKRARTLAGWMIENGEPNRPGLPNRPPLGTGENLYKHFVDTYRGNNRDDDVCNFVQFKATLQDYWPEIQWAAPSSPTISDLTDLISQYMDDI
jgi:hypothetical protein